MDMRFNPKLNSDARYGLSIVAGFASRVISMSDWSLNVLSMVDSIFSNDLAGISDGVPPPKKMVPTWISSKLLLYSVISEHTASTYVGMSVSSPAYVLKSQYEHLTRQKGTCTYILMGLVRLMVRIHHLNAYRHNILPTSHLLLYNIPLRLKLRIVQFRI